MTAATPASAACTETSDEPCCDQPGEDISGCPGELAFYRSTAFVFIAATSALTFMVLVTVRGRRLLAVGHERGSDP